MHLSIVAMLVAAMAGLLMAVQGTFNARLSKVVGLVEATLLVHLIGLVTIAIILLAQNSVVGGLIRICQAPRYTLLGGALGVAIIYGVAGAIPKLGVAVATTAIITGQILTAVLIDHFGLFGMERVPLSWHRVVGAVLLAAGVWFLLRR